MHLSNLLFGVSPEKGLVHFIHMLEKAYLAFSLFSAKTELRGRPN